jgi:FtsZ-interacting cell division protein ZipA
MEIIIFVAVIVVAALLWSGYVKTKKTESDHAIDNWEPSKILNSKDEPWPFGEKLPEGKIHVKVADVAPVASASDEDRVEAPATVVEAVPTPVVEPAPAKKPTAKKTAAKPAAAKKAPAKKKSV